MKRVFEIIHALIAVAVISAACARVQSEDPGGGEIRFQVAGYASATGTRAPSDYKDGYGSVPFGAYAWYKDANPSNNADFMVNQKVAYNADENEWFTVGNAYYWPKGGSLDFICYSPYSDAGIPDVDEDRISYNSWDVAANPDTDLLYGDKKTGLIENKTTYYYSGVPVLFRHALARVAFTVRLAYSEMVPDTGDKTRWEVTLNSVKLKDIHMRGSLDLTLEGGSWKLPENGVWLPDDSVRDMEFDCSALSVLSTTDPQNVGDAFFVLPQPLNLGQKLVLNLTIETYRDTGSGYPAEPFIREVNLDMEAPLRTDSFNAWSMNQNIRYNLILAPSLSPDGVNPVEVNFDPAVAGWETVELETIVFI